jgi:hypothetical protein
VHEMVQADGLGVLSYAVMLGREKCLEELLKDQSRVDVDLADAKTKLTPFELCEAIMRERKTEWTIRGIPFGEQTSDLWKANKIWASMAEKIGKLSRKGVGLKTVEQMSLRAQHVRNICGLSHFLFVF